MPWFIFDRCLFLALFLTLSFSPLFLKLSFNFTFFERDIIYSGFIRIQVMVCLSIRIIFEMRVELLRVMKIDHRIVLLFEQASPMGTTLLPYFPMLQFTGNESNTKIRYVLRALFHENGPQSLR